MVVGVYVYGLYGFGVLSVAKLIPGPVLAGINE